MNKHKYYLLIILFVPVVLVFLGIFLGWDEIYCIRHEIDIHSGDLREVRYIGFLPVQEKIRQTSFSRLVREILPVNQAPEWKLVNITNTPGYRTYIITDYHGAPSECNELMKILDLKQVTKEQKRELITKCMAAMESGEMDQLEETVHAAFDRYPDKE